MRMIDADALKEKAFGKRGGLIHTADIDAEPTIAATPIVYGKWEQSEYTGFLRCSVCKDCYIETSWIISGKWNYCSLCGARMDGKWGSVK